MMNKNLSRLLSQLTLILAFCISASGFAQTDSTKEERAKEIFLKKFNVMRDANGKISAVLARLGSQGFSAELILSDLIREIKSINKQSKVILSQRTSGQQFSSSPSELKTIHEQEVAEAVSSIYEDYEIGLARVSGAEYAHASRDARVEHLRLSMEAVQHDDVSTEVENVYESEHWSNFNEKLTSLLLKIRPEVLSVPHDQKYFFQRQLITQISKMIITQAAKQASSIPFLSILSEIFGQIEQIIADQRMFNQNFLLYLLENYKAETFSLTESEAAQIVSSLYQSRLGMMQLFQMKKMSEGDWSSYGWNNFYTQKRAANGVLEKFEKLIYDRSQTKRLSSAFSIVSEKGKKKIVNLFDKSHMFSSKPALAHDFDKPNKVKTIRLLIKLGQMGLGFVPMPGVLKSFANNFADSAYRAQSLTEGALAAYFAIEGHSGLSKHFVRQSINPFLR